MPPPILVASDTEPTRLTYTDAGAAVDITGYAFAFKIGYVSPLVKAAVLVDAVNGVLEFRWLSTDLVAGDWEAEIMITASGGTTKTKKLGKLRILPRVA